MLNNQTMTTLTSLGLKGMADAFGEQLESGLAHQMGHITLLSYAA